MYVHTSVSLFMLHVLSTHFRSFDLLLAILKEHNLCFITMLTKYKRKLTPCGSVLLQGLTFPQLVTKLQLFMNTKLQLFMNTKLQLFTNTKLHHGIHHGPALFFTLSQINPVQFLPVYFSILILSSHLHLALPGGHLPLRFPTIILYAFIFCSS